MAEQQLDDSPETTGKYECSCGNSERFIGYDDHGYPGSDECTCELPLCVCEVTLRQPFLVGNDGVDYQAFTGGGNGAEISSYDRIECAVCGTQIWPEVKRG